MAILRRINLDYQSSPNPPRRLAGWMLLFAGLALLAEMGASYDRLQNERQVMIGKSHLAGLHPASSQGKPARTYTEKDLRAARLIMSRLSIGWDRIFSDFESIKNKNVAVLTFEPDTQTGLLRITGEGKDFPSVLTFVSQLRTRKSFSDVFLQQQDVKRDDPQHPVSFTISVRWMKPL